MLGNTIDLPAVCQFDRAVHASDDYKEGCNAEANEHQYDSSCDVFPTRVFARLSFWKDTCWAVESIANNKLDGEDGVKYDGNYSVLAVQK